MLEGLPNGGYAVKSFSERDIADATELRGTLEGLLVRLAALRGAPAVVLAEPKDCLGIGLRRDASRYSSPDSYYFDSC